MNLFKFYFRTALFLTTTALLSPFYVLILIAFYRWRHRIGPKLVQFYSKICLMIFKVRVEQINNHHNMREPENGTLIVANHTSFLDIFVLSALFGTVFVSKAEVKYYPVIGQIAWLMGVVFLERTSAHEKLRVLNTIAQGCKDKIIVVFPQGTTSSSAARLSFSRGIFKVIELNPDISLLPVTLYYKEDATIAWNKPQSLKEHAVRVSSQERINIKVIMHQPVTIAQYKGKTASEICRMVEQTVLGPLQEDYRGT
jgi:1-acyl-sn-glycerol-3-phosphate acyltransferase